MFNAFFLAVALLATPARPVCFSRAEVARIKVFKVKCRQAKARCIRALRDAKSKAKIRCDGKVKKLILDLQSAHDRIALLANQRCPRCSLWRPILLGVGIGVVVGVGGAVALVLAVR